MRYFLRGGQDSKVSITIYALALIHTTIGICNDAQTGSNYATVISYQTVRFALTTIRRYITGPETEFCRMVHQTIVRENVCNKAKKTRFWI